MKAWSVDQRCLAILLFSGERLMQILPWVYWLLVERELFQHQMDAADSPNDRNDGCRWVSMLAWTGNEHALISLYITLYSSLYNSKESARCRARHIRSSLTQTDQKLVISSRYWKKPIKLSRLHWPSWRGLQVVAPVAGRGMFSFLCFQRRWTCLKQLVQLIGQPSMECCHGVFLHPYIVVDANAWGQSFVLTTYPLNQNILWCIPVYRWRCFERFWLLCIMVVR